MGKTRSLPDLTLMTAALLLLTIGVIMVYSASAVLSFHDFGDKFYYMKRQLLFAVLGVAAMLVTMNVDYTFWKKWSKPILLTCFALLVLVLIPGIGNVRGGARSWLGIGSFGIQPSEFMKMALILFLSRYLSDNQGKITLFWKGLLPPLALMG